MGVEGWKFQPGWSSVPTSHWVGPRYLLRKENSDSDNYWMHQQMDKTNRRPFPHFICNSDATVFSQSECTRRFAAKRISRSLPVGRTKQNWPRWNVFPGFNHSKVPSSGQKEFLATLFPSFFSSCNTVLIDVVKARSPSVQVQWRTPSKFANVNSNFSDLDAQKCRSKVCPTPGDADTRTPAKQEVQTPKGSSTPLNQIRNPSVKRFSQIHLSRADNTSRRNDVICRRLHVCLSGRLRRKSL